MKSKPVILVVDDQPQNIELLEAHLSLQGYEIVKATNGEEALEKLSDNQIDLILLDVRMPGMDGYEVTRRIRQDDTHRRLPIILVTVLRETEDRVKGIEAGCDDFVSSPVDKMELLARVRSLLKVKAYNDLMSHYRKELETEVNLRTGELKQALERLQQDTAKRKLAEEALRESEAKYRLLINTASESIVVAQGDLLKFVNPMAINLMGYSEQELMSRPFSEFIHPDDRSMVVEYYRRRIANEAQQPRYSFRVVAQDGIVKWVEISAALIEWQGKAATLNFLTEITERKRAEAELLESKALVDAVVENVPLMIFLKEATDLRFVIFNRAGEELLGHDRKELLGKNNLDLFPPEQAANFMAKDREALAGQGMVDIPEEPILTARKGQRLLHTRKICILGADGATKYLLGISEDITERKRAEEVLKAERQRLHDVLEVIPMMVCLLTPDHHVAFANRAFRDKFGESHGRHCYEYCFGKEEPCDYCESYEVLKTGKPHCWQVTSPDGSGIFEVNDFPFTDVDGSPMILELDTDITERKRAEEGVQASLREKEILLREIHHRVKNNMQIISSLFNLQAGHVKDEDARRMLKEGQLRIRSMALVHEKLYQSRDLSKIDFADYLRSLSVHLFQFFMVEADRIRLETDLEDVHLDINSAVPCGLLVTELMTNALKHAFPGDRKGVIGIRLHRQEDGTVELRVADDGVGFPEAVDFRHTESLGLQIVCLLVGQLEGTIELDRKKGTVFTIVFRELGYKART